MTQQNAALVEQASAAAESMQEQAAKLMEEVGVFKLHGMETNSMEHNVVPLKTPVRKQQPQTAAPPPVRKPVQPKRVANALKPKMSITTDTGGLDWEEF